LKISILTNEIPKKFQNFPCNFLLILGKKEISENFNIPENNITSVEDANLSRHC
jgi:hypothetical protein